MITKFEKYQLITENPDHIFSKVNGEKLSWCNEDAVPFLFNVNKQHTKVLATYIGFNGDAHYDIKRGKGMYRRGQDSDKDNKTYPGRLWLNSKIISFWIYPNIQLFKDMINKLEKKLKIKIFNNDWKIEIIKSDGEITIRNFDDIENNIYYAADNNNDGDIEIIPIEDYIGSLDVPEEQKLWHLMNAEEKRIAKLKGKAPDFRGWGSDITAWDGKRPLPYRQAIYQEKNNL